MARLCRTTLRHPLLLVAGCGFWNFGVLLGVIALPAGMTAPAINGSSFRRYVAIVLFVAYTLILSWAVLMFRFRRGEQVFTSRNGTCSARSSGSHGSTAPRTVMLFVVAGAGRDASRR
jgi:hypothetical protein